MGMLLYSQVDRAGVCRGVMAGMLHGLLEGPRMLPSGVRQSCGSAHKGSSNSRRHWPVGVLSTQVACECTGQGAQRARPPD